MGCIHVEPLSKGLCLSFIPPQEHSHTSVAANWHAGDSSASCPRALWDVNRRIQGSNHLHLEGNLRCSLSRSCPCQARFNLANLRCVVCRSFSTHLHHHHSSFNPAFYASIHPCIHPLIPSFPRCCAYLPHLSSVLQIHHLELRKGWRLRDGFPTLSHFLSTWPALSNNFPLYSSPQSFILPLHPFILNT